VGARFAGVHRPTLRRMHRAAFALAVAALAGCGGGESKSAPAAWCSATARIVYLLDQHSTTLTVDEIGEWEKATPEEVQSDVANAADVLRRYPVDADAPALVAARKEIEAYADDQCAEGWRDLAPRPPR
jgi:ABC-type glycerol-3-phosphate transport system substrate-binding protein